MQRRYVGARFDVFQALPRAIGPGEAEGQQGQMTDFAATPPLAMDFDGAGDGRERALALMLLSMADDRFGPGRASRPRATSVSKKSRAPRSAIPSLVLTARCRSPALSSRGRR